MSKRHLRFWHWGTARDLLTRQEIRSLDGINGDQPSTGRRRKPTRIWCRGVRGRPHVPEIVIPENQRWRWNVCRPAEPWQQREWSCAHVERCSVCGKVLRHGWQLEDAECPDRRTT